MGRRIELWLSGAARLVTYNEEVINGKVTYDIIAIDSKTKHSLSLDDFTEAINALKKELITRSINAL